MRKHEPNKLGVIQAKIFGMHALKQSMKIWRLQGRTVVFTNGCFDILHFGHIQYLAQAKDLGDILVVGVNSDESVRAQKKGAARPIQDETSRLTILAALGAVDAVILFNEETPEQLINELIPDILVKGADYADITKIVGYDTVTKHGGKVQTITFAEGFSTSAIEKKIRES